MASSSKTNQDFDPAKQQEDEKERDWLELGLGFGSVCKNPVDMSSSASSSSTSSLPLQQTQQRLELGLGLGLGLGFGNECVALPAGSNYDLYHHDHNMVSSLGLFTSPSLLSWPLHVDVDSSNSFLGLHDRLMPVPDDTYHRPHPGLWFTLRSSINRNGEELPQLTKAYIRVKDENVTVFMVKTYLVRKLGLSNEAEVDISCMGQKLWQWQTLKQVRDAIWFPGLVESLNYSSQNSESNAMFLYQHHHLMSLNYGRPCFFN
ncbi:unnamed protein product [Camellia sinensis]